MGSLDFFPKGSSYHSLLGRKKNTLHETIGKKCIAPYHQAFIHGT